MEAGRLNGLLRHLHRSVERGDDAAADAELLTRLVESHDREAFAALARRHARMVWGVCRRLLGEDDAAEDAFQATFLVLARKAAAVRPRSMLANWLYGVAHRTALEARRAAAIRRAKEQRAAAMAERAYTPNDPSEDLRALLDQELASLPDKYRAPLVLCDLAGLTRKEAARRLGWSEGTLSGRLFRARALLAGRLAGRGLSVCGGALAGLLAEANAAGPPASLVTSILQTALPATAGPVATASAGAAALAEGVLKAMLLTQLKVVASGVVVACLALTVGSAGYRVQATEPAAEPAPPKGGTPAQKDADLIQQQHDRLQVEREQVAQLKRELDAARARAEQLQKSFIDMQNQLNYTQQRLVQAQAEEGASRKEAAEARGALQRSIGEAVASDKQKDQLKKLLAEREEAAAQAAIAQERLRSLNERIAELRPAGIRPPSALPSKNEPAKSAELILRDYQITELVADGRGGESPIPSADVISVITQMVAPDSWTTQGGPGTIAYLGKTRTLFVKQTREVHEEVARMLNHIRELAVQHQREVEEMIRRSVPPKR